MNQLKMQFVLFMLILLTILMPNTQSKKERNRLITFQEFKATFNKTYNSLQEEKNRSSIFNQNHNKINQKKGCTTCGITQFSDMTQQQFQKKYLKLLSLTNVKQQKARQKKFSNASIDYPKSSSIQVSAAPSSFDWRTKNAITSVKDQGDCGACWAFSGTAVTESYAIIKNLATNKTDLAQQYLLQCTNYSDCDGGYIQFGMDTVISGKGMPNQTTYPYNYYTSYSGICSAKKSVANPSPYRISKYSRIQLT